MTDLTTVLPGFPSQSYARLLPSLERNHVTTADLVSLDAVEIARRAQLPLPDVRSLSSAVLDALRATLGIGDAASGAPSSSPLRKPGEDILTSWNTISTLDDQLDLVLGGGIPVGYVTEVVGER
jgi:DNA repair protein RAD57